MYTVGTPLRDTQGGIYRVIPPTNLLREAYTGIPTIPLREASIPTIPLREAIHHCYVP